MPLKRKLGVSIVFDIGAIALLSSIMRLYYTSQLSYNRDKTFIFAEVALWTTAGVATVILCGSFPFLPKLVRHIKESRSSKPPKPVYEQLKAYHRAKSGLNVPETAISDEECVGVVEVPRTLP